MALNPAWINYPQHHCHSPIDTTSTVLLTQTSRIEIEELYCNVSLMSSLSGTQRAITSRLCWPRSRKRT